MRGAVTPIRGSRIGLKEFETRRCAFFRCDAPIRSPHGARLTRMRKRVAVVLLALVATTAWAKQAPPPGSQGDPRSVAPPETTPPPQPFPDGSYPLAPGVMPPHITHAVPAVYPTEAPASGHWRACELRVTIAADGVPADLSVFFSAGEAFDVAAMEAVRRSTFAPGSWNGQPVSVRIHVEVNFSADHTPAIPEVKFRVASQPALIHAVDPQYSDEARRKKITGIVRLSVLVGEDGVPTDMRVEKSLGHGLDEKALERSASIVSSRRPGTTASRWRSGSELM
jgi:TonB family protein